MTVTQAQLNAMNKPYPQAAKQPPSKDMGKDAFMKLFVAQLKHQDPLNPLSNKDSTAQMAQFAQLEQMTNMTTLLKGIANGLVETQKLQASGLIGKSILAGGDTLRKTDDTSSGVTLDIPKEVTKLKVNIHDDAGNIVRTVDVKKFSAGKHPFNWDGKLANGAKATDGIYRISIVAENDDGKRFLVPTQVEGTVAGVETRGGHQILSLEDGREVFLKNVTKIVAQKKAV